MGNETSKLNDPLIATALAMEILYDAEFDSEVENKRKGEGNQHSDRDYVIRYIDSWPDDMLKKHFV